MTALAEFKSKCSFFSSFFPPFVPVLAHTGFVGFVVLDAAGEKATTTGWQAGDATIYLRSALGEYLTKIPFVFPLY